MNTAAPTRSRAPRVRIADIALKAGVSVPTVSKVLNGRQDVAADTRKRVQSFLDESGYRRRGSNRPSRAGLVDFVITDLSTSWGCELLRGAEREAHRLGIGLVVTVTHDQRSYARQWIKTLASRRSDGVVLVVSRVQEDVEDKLSQLGTPFVLVDPVGGFNPAVPSIGATNWAGGFAATEHLAGLGHGRIGIVTGPADLVCSEERLDGYRAALRRADIPLDDSLVVHGNFYADGGARGASELLSLADPPTAIFAGSDQQARGIYDEARRRRLRIPDDLSVIGFDDVELCTWLTPQLTTVRQPLANMAGLAIRTVVEPPDFDRDHPLRVELSTNLVTRASTAPPRRR